jgi:hypothetical protein
LWQTDVISSEEDWLDYSQGKLPSEPVEV